MDATTDNCTVSGWIDTDNVHEANMVFWSVQVPNQIDLPNSKATSGTVKLTKTMLIEASLDAGYTIAIDDSYGGLTAGEKAAIVVGSCAFALFVITFIVMWFQYHECIWVKDVPHRV